jgi:HPt (histidine-containing phosphotransfer) domain-containing protein
VGTFLESRRPALDAMVRALGGDTDVPLRRLAHRAAGSFGLYGFRWASDQCRRIEREAEGADRARLEGLLAALQRHLETVEIRCDGVALR